MRSAILLTLLAASALALAVPASAQPSDPVSTGSPCLNGGVTLIVLGHTVLQCWKPWGTGPAFPPNP
jgi:hypothetical protein